MNNVIITGSDFYKKRETLEKVKTDSDGWEVYYIDKNNGEKWIAEYPYAEMHGGGPPQLRLIDAFPWDDR